MLTTIGKLPVERQEYIQGFLRVDLIGLQEMVEKAKEILTGVEEKNPFDFDDPHEYINHVLNVPVVYFELEADKTKLKLMIGSQEVGYTKVLEFVGEGKYRDLEISSIEDIFEFVSHIDPTSTLDGEVMYLYFSVKKVIFTSDRDCLVIY